MQVVQIGMLFKVLFTFVIKKVVDIICLDVGLQNTDKGLTTLAIFNHEVYHCIDKLI